MKRIFTILLLLVFTLRPIYSIGYFAYFQLNIDSIIEKYCVNKDTPELACNGKCHLMKTITQSETPTDDFKGVLYISDAFFPVFCQQENVDFNKKTFLELQSNNWITNSLHPTESISKLEQPPDFIA